MHPQDEEAPDSSPDYAAGKDSSDPLRRKGKDPVQRERRGKKFLEDTKTQRKASVRYAGGKFLQNAPESEEEVEED